MKTIRCRQMFVLTIALLGGLFLPNAFAIVNLSDKFDADTAGLPVPGWSIGGPMTGVVDNAFSRSAPNSMMLVQTQLLSAAYAYKALSPTISTSTNAAVGVSFSVYASQPHGQFNFMLSDSSFTPYIAVAFASSGQIWAQTNGANYDVLANYSPGIWYDVELKFNPSRSVFDFKVSTNGTPIVNATSLVVADASRPNIANFEIVSYGNADHGNAVMHVDNVFVEVPEPGSLAWVAAAVGGFVLMRRRGA